LTVLDLRVKPSPDPLSVSVPMAGPQDPQRSTLRIRRATKLDAWEKPLLAGIPDTMDQ